MSDFYLDAVKSNHLPDYVDEAGTSNDFTYTIGGSCSSNEDVVEQVQNFVKLMTGRDVDFSEYEDSYECVDGRYLMSARADISFGYKWFSKL